MPTNCVSSKVNPLGNCSPFCGGYGPTTCYGKRQGERSLLRNSCYGVGQKAQDPNLRWEGYLALGVVLAYGGEFTTSLQHLEQAIALYVTVPESIAHTEYWA